MRTLVTVVERDATGVVVRGNRFLDYHYSIWLNPGNSAWVISDNSIVVDTLKDRTLFTVLCASDPYAVLGVKAAFNHRLHTDLVAGPATNTTAALDLVEKLTGLPGINIIDPDKLPVFRDFLVHILQIGESAAEAPRSA